MEIPNYENLHFIFRRHLFFSSTIVMLLLATTPFTHQTSMENTSFSFNQFTPDKKLDIKLEGDAYISSSIIELTKDMEVLSSNLSVGRATYGRPMHLWDKASGNLADFATHFSFVIFSHNSDKKGSGFTFFLAPNGSQLQPLSGGSHLGLLSRQNSSTVPSFVAVEFDTRHSSKWDPEGVKEHIGIDLNSMASVKIKEWSWNGGRFDASIYYNSSSKNLSVSVTNGYIGSASMYSCGLYFLIDLKDYLPEWVTFGFSASTSMLHFEKHKIYSWGFTSSLKLPENFTSPQLLLTKISRERKGKSWWLWPVLGFSGTLVFVLVFVWFCCWMKGRMRNSDDEFGKENGPRHFAYEELIAATNKFSTEKLLGQGGSGKVYEGFLRNWSAKVAVKWITSKSQQGLKEYESEVKAISQLRHRNLVKLKGWCRKKQELLLVYEFVPNKSLDFHLANKTGFLTWEKRYRIALGLASVLYYLQEECEQYVLHRDIKSSNVLLDSNFNAKLGDFGLARFVEHGEGSHTTVLIGTPGYIAPEYAESCKPTKKSEIYSFGIVALEIASGKLAFQQVDGNGSNGKMKLVQWAWKHYGSGNISAVADPELEQNYAEEEMKCLILLGLLVLIQIILIVLQ
ncbi:hypothetical protein GH714_040570 [Hevea brasiliensis]|uniref:non-specific serine/threonine protein kinase n=1 Tax=Hevea brasiliensis TaxID=3981 RepID=A0A6A6L5B3_HEVBR|nr:hypothetical protein GH714_040570 [Hevea brasiliensis]